MKRSIRRLGVGLIVLYGALFVQLNLVQVLNADEYNENPGNTREIVRDFSRPRGQIVSADGTVLARSREIGGRYERQREYPTGDLFGQITGFFSFNAGADGVEKAYNDELSGRAAPTSVDQVADLFVDEERTADVVLTVDATVQQAARDALGNRLGSIVALDPRNGSILALWSTPSYDPNPLSSVDQKAASAARNLALADPNKPLLTRSYRETFFPGSTFKIVTGSAGLQSGTVTRDTPSYPVRSGYVPNGTNAPIRNFGGSACGGSLFEGLEVSCNTVFAQMADDIGGEQLRRTGEGFGFNEAPPIDLPEAAASRLGASEGFESSAVTAQTGIGQNDVSATPLQMALATAGIANDGVVMRPHVMAEVRDDEGRAVRAYQPQEWRRALTPEQSGVMREAMVNVVANGTATRLAVDGVPTAGKTGTAQAGTGLDLNHAWVVGYAPADAPRVVVAVLVESVPGVGVEATGGRLAAPMGKTVLQAALAATAG
ncbi:MAG: penicillin-binding protein 2 [Acidimicrobiia bacterium]|nr:penicillin-binding protein 2 [Acidimicrobiia bacterium]